MDTEMIQIGSLTVPVIRKAIKRVYLSVHPPEGRVTLTVPVATRLDVARSYAVTQLHWIHNRQRAFAEQRRETAREFLSRESHFLWGRRYLLTVIEADAKPSVTVEHSRLVLQVRPGSDTAQRSAVMQAWYRTLLRRAAEPLIAAWQPRLGVNVTALFVQKMKTQWGSCNPRRQHIRLNTELAKKPPELLEYVIVHELTHLREPTHGQRFTDILDTHYPTWRDARAELNRLPLAAEKWGE